MACNTSEVAVCCSSASLKSSVRWCSSPSSRAFSMAMTACFAKLLDKLDLFIAKWPHLPSINGDDANRFILFEHRHCDHCPDASNISGGNGRLTTFTIASSLTQVGYRARLPIDYCFVRRHPGAGAI